jgi:hypothetical protein
MDTKNSSEIMPEAGHEMMGSRSDHKKKEDFAYALHVPGEDGKAYRNLRKWSQRTPHAARIARRRAIENDRKSLLLWDI